MANKTITQIMTDAVNQTNTNTSNVSNLVTQINGLNTTINGLKWKIVKLTYSTSDNRYISTEKNWYPDRNSIGFIHGASFSTFSSSRAYSSQLIFPNVDKTFTPYFMELSPETNYTRAYVAARKVADGSTMQLANNIYLVYVTLPKDTQMLDLQTNNNGEYYGG